MNGISHTLLLLLTGSPLSIPTLAGALRRVIARSVYNLAKRRACRERLPFEWRVRPQMSRDPSVPTESVDSSRYYRVRELPSRRALKLQSGVAEITLDDIG